jgi:hypothetical protein
MRATLLSLTLLSIGCSSAPVRVEVQLIKPPAQFLVTRISPDWTPGSTNQALGEYAKRQQVGWQSCEDDRAAIAEFVKAYELRVGAPEAR